jgi:hypothetical protein
MAAVRITVTALPGRPRAAARPAHHRIDAVRAAHPGLAEAQLTRLEDGPCTDVWCWESAEQMQAALAAMPIPKADPAMSLTSGATAVSGEVVDQRCLDVRGDQPCPPPRPTRPTGPTGRCWATGTWPGCSQETSSPTSAQACSSSPPPCPGSRCWWMVRRAELVGGRPGIGPPKPSTWWWAPASTVAGIGPAHPATPSGSLPGLLVSGAAATASACRWRSRFPLRLWDAGRRRVWVGLRWARWVGAGIGRRAGHPAARPAAAAPADRGHRPVGGGPIVPAVVATLTVAMVVVGWVAWCGAVYPRRRRLPAVGPAAAGAAAGGHARWTAGSMVAAPLGLTAAGPLIALAGTAGGLVLSGC